MLMIFGANGPSGRQLIQRLPNPQAAVAALRLPETDDFFARHHIPTTVADALDADAIARAVQQFRPDTVVSFIGGKNEQGIRSDATGNLHIIRALEQHAPQARLILVTSMGCGEQYALMSDMFKQALGEAVAAKTEAENALRQSPLAWTILRPCGLADGDDTTYQLHEQLPAIPCQYMTRTALAAAVRQIIDEDGHEGKAYSVTSGEAA
ncbi:MULTISPECIES: NAD(P)-dependent oxidoreductase [Eikenella]|uniref:NAD-dependent epimerase/dehydratase family protein n=1 Tax=Eikenella exigua TaxID=2528037 RepID=A0AAX1F8I5_9NEIS|nr:MULTISPECIES: NAD(P)H-binding protein [Eikenella]OAM42999.1 nucleoside-diphosphate sugar epimerase [Eikenella sp. NML97-A-109]QED92388.1 NAD-dependent epimerase/dehydratase family protein [Eikenella exigua]